MSFDEINLLSVQDLLDLVRSYSGVEEDTPREATQEDIDALLA